MKQNFKLLLVGTISMLVFAIMVLISPDSAFGYGYSYGYGDNYYEECVTKKDNPFCSDIEFPVLKEISFSPNHVNTDLGDQEIIMTARITDNSSGYDGFCIRFRSVEDGSDNFITCDGRYVEGSNTKLIGENATEAIINKILVLPAGSTSGNWKIAMITMTDGYGNYIRIDDNDLKTEEGNDIIAFVNDTGDNKDESVCYDWDGDGWGWDGEKGCKMDSNDDADDNNDDEDDDDNNSTAGECVDWDGDGWGWDGEKGCKMDSNDDNDDNNDNNNSTAGECVDWDGDGWGWDGEKGCKMDSNDDNDDNNDNNNSTAGECVDWDGDGWGWDGEKGCKMDSNDDNDDNNDNNDNDNSTAGECVDWDGDGWGWDGEKGCKMPS